LCNGCYYKFRAYKCSDSGCVSIRFGNTDTGSYARNTTNIPFVFFSYEKACIGAGYYVNLADYFIIKGPIVNYFSSRTNKAIYANDFNDI